MTELKGTGAITEQYIADLMKLHGQKPNEGMATYITTLTKLVDEVKIAETQEDDLLPDAYKPTGLFTIVSNVPDKLWVRILYDGHNRRLDVFDVKPESPIGAPCKLIEIDSQYKQEDASQYGSQ